jgi:hypothetical protein
LQFHPTRIPAIVRRVIPKSNSSSSPLRKKSKSNEGSQPRLGVNDYNDSRIEGRLDRSRSNLSGGYKTKGSASPLRFNTNKPIVEEPVESSENYQESPAHDINNRQSSFNLSRVPDSSAVSVTERPNTILNQNIPPNAREKLYRERIEAMTLDNQSL